MHIARRLGTFLERHPVLILVLVVVLSGLAAWSASGMSIVTSQEAFLSPKSAAFAQYRANEAAFGGDAMLMLIPGSPDELTDGTALAKLANLEAKLEADSRIRSVTSPLTLLRPAAAGAGVDVAAPGFARQVAYAGSTPRPEFARFLPKGHELVVVRLAGGLSVDQQTAAVRFIEDTAASAGYSDAVVAGYPRLIRDVTSSVKSDLARTGAIAVALMVVVLFVAFPVRWRLLSLPVVLIGVLWTFGIAAAVGIPLTLVTMAGLPVLIGLGADFAIQFHNRYDEEMQRGDTPAQAVIDAISHIGPVVGVAVIATALGFLTLLISAVPAVRDFGILLTVGVVVLYAAGLFVVNTVLYRFDRAPSTASPARRGIGFLRRDWLRLGPTLPVVARWCRRHVAWVVVPAVLLAGIGFVADGHLLVQTQIEKLIPTGTPGVVALGQARAVLGSSSELPLLVTAKDVTDPRVMTWMSDFQARALKAYPDLLSADSLTAALGLSPGNPAPSPKAVGTALSQMPATVRDSLVTPDRVHAAIVFGVKEVPISEQNRLIDDLMANARPPAGVTVSPGGTVTLAARAVSATTSRRGLIAAVGIAAVFLGLLAIYRNWRRAVVAVVPIVLVTGWSSGLMWLIGVNLNPLTAVLGVLIIAIGTEFTVLLLGRYWEERAKGAGPDQASDEAVARIGRAICASGLTVVAGFGALIVSSFPALRDFGIMTVIAVILALIATLTVVPALLHWLDRGAAGSDATPS